MDEALNKSIGWIEDNIFHFKLNDNRYTDDLQITLKPFGELVLTLTLLKKHGINDKRIDNLLIWAWEELQNGKILMDLLIARNDLIVLTCIYVDFYHIGYKSEKLEFLIKYLSTINPTSHIENPYWRRLDIDYTLSKLGLKTFPKKPLKKSWLGKSLPPWMINNDLAYAITHEVFYVTDFGQLPNRIENEIRLYIEKWIFSWIEVFKLENNYDLVIEFAIVCICLNIELPVTLYDEVYHTQKNDGRFTGPKNAGANWLKPNDPKERIDFVSDYHTTLVGCIFLAMKEKKLPITSHLQ